MLEWRSGELRKLQEGAERSSEEAEWASVMETRISILDTLQSD